MGVSNLDGTMSSARIGSATANRVLDELLRALALGRDGSGGAIAFIDDDPIAATRHRPGAAAAAAIAAEAVGIATIWRMRGGEEQDIKVDLRRCVVPGLRSLSYQTQNGHPLTPPPVEREESFFRTKDGRVCFLLRSPHPADQLASLLSLLKCGNETDQLVAAVAKWNAFELEETLARLRLTGAVARTAAEWRASPQGQILASTPPVQVTKIGDSPPMPFKPAPRPLSGLRVLDLARYLAGPVAARILAEQGADVLRCTEPLNPDSPINIMDTNTGKRSAFLDLARAEDLDQLMRCIDTADVFIQGFRPGSLAKFGLSSEALAARRPGIIYLSVSAFGGAGPWMNRGAFDPIAQTVTGLAVAEGSAEAPELLPVGLPNDYTSGYLAVAGIVSALVRRAVEGGSYHVEVSLARTSMWLQDIGQLPEDPKATRAPGAPLCPAPRDSDFVVRNTVYGALRQCAPLVEFSTTRPYWERGPFPLGSSLLEWLDRGTLG
jgi:crotonobetainyl-CoA:carnitine CoA-transferase CaiB-like acyl-CoA transferase